MTIYFKTSPTGRAGRFVLTLVFAFFIAVGGVFFFLALIRPIARLLSARHWVATPCEILSSEVGSHVGGEDGGPTYSVDVHYAYTFAGHRYESDRYDVVNGSSSGYEGKAIVVARYPVGSSAVCYVNPRAPDQAVIDRGFSSVMLFGLFPLVFVLVGAGGIAWTIWSGKNSVPQKSVEETKPWLAQPDWAAGRVKPTSKFKLVFFWGFTIVWNLFSFPMAIALIADVLSHPFGKLVWLILFFPIAGVGLLIITIQSTLRWRKYGKVIFEMASVPGVIGGALEGRVRLGQMLRPAGNSVVKLKCVQRGVGDSNDIVLWETVRKIPGGMTEALPVLFAIPGDCPETRATKPIIVWQLEVNVKVPGLDLIEQFYVPVFKVTPTAEQVAAAQRARAVERDVQAHYDQPTDSLIKVQTSTRGGKEFVFPAGRNRGAARGALLFMFILAGVIWLTRYFQAPMAVSIFVGLFELFFLSLVINFSFRSTRVVIEDETITVTGNFLGHAWRQAGSTKEIERIYLKPGLTFGTTTFRDIKISLRNRPAITAASNLNDLQEAQWLVAQMTQAAGFTS